MPDYPVCMDVELWWENFRGNFVYTRMHKRGWFYQITNKQVYAAVGPENVGKNNMD